MIKLRPEYEERYIILHKHTFPGVLKRIHDSNIGNYSIFLWEGTLCSYYEYSGQDYDDDMQKMAEDTIVEDWWKLTDPMQEPFLDRKEGEWWASMEETGHFSGTKIPHAHTQRIAYMAKEDPIRVQHLLSHLRELPASSISNLDIFNRKQVLFLYCELSGITYPSEVENMAKRIVSILSPESPHGWTAHWKRMREVFHTDG